VGFVAFGIVALLALACLELLVEACESDNGDMQWVVQALPFAGIYLILMLAHAIG
jgi:hypothetical protein